MDPWPALFNEEEIPSPALLFSSERLDTNLRRMVELVGDPARLRPHAKTHKTPQIIQRLLALGVTKAKCATIAEAEMCASAGATDILLAQQPVGPNVARLLALQRAFPAAAFSTLLDDADALAALNAAAMAAHTKVTVLLDLDNGMHRTGLSDALKAVSLYRRLCASPGLRPGGLHAYDGHLGQTNPKERGMACDAAFAPVAMLKAELESLGFLVPRIVMGGTPTFPMHARRTGVECSPGTLILHDAGYARRFPDLRFEWAAVLLTRVLSKPAGHLLCLDLGHKAVASEMPAPRMIFPALPDAVAVTHSEEHLVLETAHAPEYHVGSALYAIPWHICPTVALHAEARLVRGLRAVETWPIVARARRLTI